jgi:hypothetical protein
MSPQAGGPFGGFAKVGEFGGDVGGDGLARIWGLNGNCLTLSGGGNERLDVEA